MGYMSSEYFVKVEGPPENARRNPKGVYKLDVAKNTGDAGTDIDLILNEAVQIIPFLSENMPRFSLKLFSIEGDEIRAGRSVCHNECEVHVHCERARDYPAAIDV